MEQLINNFSKGLHKDINKIDSTPNTVYHLFNGRILSDKGQDNFSISTLEGNVLDIDINTYYNGFSIIGYTTVREDIVLFLADDGNQGYGKIVLLEYNNKVGDLNNFTVKTLYENNNLKFFKGFPILDDMVVSRYETPEIIKIYWTDGYNKLRFLNIAPDNPSSPSKTYNNCQSTPLDQLDIVQDVKLNVPEFTRYTSGNLNSGMIQYAYRLYNLKGAETIFSTASELIPLTKYNDKFGTEYLRGQATGGQDLDTNSGKGVAFKITLTQEIVDKFDKIEVISLWYADRLGLPNINIIDNKDVSLVVNCIDEGGIAEYGTLELETYRDEKIEFTCQTLATKDNRLFVGNITDRYFDVSPPAPARPAASRRRRRSARCHDAG